jgi:ribosomal protein S18 acetylase RimI-like enzyme
VDPSPTEPEVRPARPADATAVGALLAEALASKYRPALGDHAARGIAALLLDDLDGTGSSRHWVAEIDGRAAGVVRLVLADEPGVGYLRALAGELGWWRALRATAVLSMLGQGRVGPDEAYIDELAVADWARRRGVARALMRRCEQEAVDAGRTRLTLWVTDDNAAARTLYADAGFRVVRRRRWIVARWVFGSPGASFMAWELPRD